MPLLPGRRARAAARRRPGRAGHARAAPPRARARGGGRPPARGWVEETRPGRLARAPRALRRRRVRRRPDACSCARPWDPPAATACSTWCSSARGGGFGSGSHPTTRMCLELLLDARAGGRRGRPGLRPRDARDRRRPARLGAGGRRRPDGRRGRRRARRTARATASRGVARRPTSRSAPVPLAALVLVNAPPPVHARVAAALARRAGAARTSIASGVVAGGARRRRGALRRRRLGGRRRARGGRLGRRRGWSGTVREDVLDPDRAAAAGARVRPARLRAAGGRAAVSRLAAGRVRRARDRSCSRPGCSGST